MSLNIHIEIASKEGETIAEINVPQINTDETLRILGKKGKKNQLKEFYVIMEENYPDDVKIIKNKIDLAIRDFGLIHINIYML